MPGPKDPLSGLRQVVRISRKEVVVSRYLEAGPIPLFSAGLLQRWIEVLAVVADDAASLAEAEALIAETASNGLVLDELLWTIGLARWLPDGHPDRMRLMARAIERIDECGFGGLRQFLDS